MEAEMNDWSFAVTAQLQLKNCIEPSNRSKHWELSSLLIHSPCRGKLV